MTESLRDRLIRVAKAVPFRYTDIVDAILGEITPTVAYDLGFAQGRAAAEAERAKENSDE
jgi:hypothetical protein